MLLNLFSSPLLLIVADSFGQAGHFPTAEYVHILANHS